MNGAAAGLGVMMLFAGALVFMLYGCFFPTVALVTIAVGFLVSTVFGTLVPGVGWIAHFLVLLPPSFAAFMIMKDRERGFQESPTYRRVRHVLRLIVTAFVSNLVATFVSEMDNLRMGQSVVASFSVTRVLIVLAAVALVHFVGRWYDRQIVAGLQAHEPSAGSEDAIGEMPASALSGKPRRSLTIPGMARAPATLQRGLAVMTMLGALFGAFLGYANYESLSSSTVGLLAGSIAGALLMLVCWIATRPFGGLFERVPVLWPVLFGVIIGVGIAWRLALADKVPVASYLLAGVPGGIVALTVPYLAYTVVRRFFFKTVRSP